MASEPALDHGSPNSKLNSAISDFAASFIKRELQQLTRECDEMLGNVHVPKIRSLLVEVDQERQVFEDARKKMLQNLHKKLKALEVDDNTIDSTISELQAMYPAYLNAIPKSTVLSVHLPTPTRSSSSGSQLSSLGDSVDIDLDHGNSGIVAPSANDKISNRNGAEHHDSPKNAGRVLRTKRTSVDHEVQEQLAVEASGTTGGQKRSRDEAFRDGADMDKTSKESAAKPTSGFPTIKTADVGPYESVFQHFGHRGYYIIRCNEDSCASFHFTEPPLLYRRAVKHFEKHRNSSAFESGEELTEKDVFLKYALEVEGVASASKEWVSEHIGSRPHTYTPRSRRINGGGKQSESAKKVRIEPADKKSNTPSRRVPASFSDNDYDEESESELDNSRRHLRRMPRQDYAELVMGKSTRVNTSASSDTGRRSSRSTSATDETDTQSTPKPTLFSSPATKIKLTDASKPFGYFGEWPRRSAPR